MNFEIKWWHIAIAVVVGVGLGQWRWHHRQDQKQAAKKERERKIERAISKAMYFVDESQKAGLRDAKRAGEETSTNPN